jgi:hypothetical protein
MVIKHQNTWNTLKMELGSWLSAYTLFCFRDIIRRSLHSAILTCRCSRLCISILTWTSWILWCHIRLLHESVGINMFKKSIHVVCECGGMHVHVYYYSRQICIVSYSQTYIIGKILTLPISSFSWTLDSIFMASLSNTVLTLSYTNPPFTYPHVT